MWGNGYLVERTILIKIYYKNSNEKICIAKQISLGNLNVPTTYKVYKTKNNFLQKCYVEILYTRMILMLLIRIIFLQNNVYPCYFKLRSFIQYI